MKAAIRCLILVSAAAAYSGCTTTEHDVEYVHHHHYYRDRDYDYSEPTVYRRDRVYTTGHVYRESEPQEFGVVNQYDRDAR